MHPHGPSGTNRCTTQIGAGQAAINTSKRNGFEMPTTVVPNIVVSNSAPAARHLIPSTRAAKTSDGTFAGWPQAALATAQNPGLR